MVKWMVIGFGVIPILGWLISLPYNWWYFGAPFTASGEWNNFPLVIATLPCVGIDDLLSGNSRVLQQHAYARMTVYTLVCAVLYAIVGLAIGSSLRLGIAGLKRAWKPRERA